MHPVGRTSLQSTRPTDSAWADASHFANVRVEDPAAFAHLLADQFVARETSSVPLTKPPPLVSDAVKLASFEKWQASERCRATYRVLFGRPLWAPASPRPGKQTFVTDDRGDAVLPTVDELLELAMDETLLAPDTTNATLEDDTVLLDLALAFDNNMEATEEEDLTDLLWAFDAKEDHEGRHGGTCKEQKDAHVGFQSPFARRVDGTENLLMPCPL